MRENIGLYRGKRIDNDEWAIGNLLVFPDLTSYICCPDADDGETLVKYSVYPEKVGECTGLTDKNGKKIFEGDIVTAQDNVIGSPFCDGITGKIVYDETAFFIEPKDPMESQWLFNECAVYKIIGNIYDNPELLEAADG